MTGRDYGVDAIVEIFDDDMPTGKVAFLQIKETNEAIVPLKRTPEYVSCPSVSDSTLDYTYQTNIPVMLIYVYLKGDMTSFIKMINDYYNKKDSNKSF